MAFAFVRRTARGRASTRPTRTTSTTGCCASATATGARVVILWPWTALLSGFVLFPLFVPQVNAFIPFGAAALGVGLYTWFHPGLRAG